MFHGYRTLLNQLFMVGYNRIQGRPCFLAIQSLVLMLNDEDMLSRIYFLGDSVKHSSWTGQSLVWQSESLS
jgi:hypothetical protein